jgi:hypothetical protein
MANRRMLQAAIDTVAAGGQPPRPCTAASAPDTIDCIAPAAAWDRHWADAVRRKREAAPWCQATAAEAAS